MNIANDIETLVSRCEELQRMAERVQAAAIAASRLRGRFYVQKKALREWLRRRGYTGPMPWMKAGHHRHAL